MGLLILRAYLLAGLVAHKVVWEALKRTPGPTAGTAPRPRSAGLLLVKAAKIAVLAGILIQTVIPDVVPLSEDPWALRLAGAALFTIGLAVAIASRLQLGRNWSDIETARVLRDQAVVSHGVYRYIRHPIYAADVLLLVGLELALNSWLVVGAAALAPVVFWKAIREERMLAESLPGYAAYCVRTKRFIPFVI
jgi:protein-S-isoprenylcysteine O-methyltransferase Ste14